MIPRGSKILPKSLHLTQFSRYNYSIEKKKLCLHSKKESVPMSINEFVEMTMFLCLICFAIYDKMQGFVDESVLKNFIEITLSHSVSKINAFLRFTQKLKMVTKSGGKMIFAKSCQ